MNYTGCQLKHELTATARVVGQKERMKVIFDGGELEAYYCGNEIHLPLIPNNASFTEEQVKQYRGIADHESFHALYTPWDMWKDLHEYCRESHDGLSMQILNGAEDVRIERLGMDEFIGVQKNLQAVSTQAYTYMAQFMPVGSPDWIRCISVAFTAIGREFNGLDINLTEGQKWIIDKFDRNAISRIIINDDFCEMLVDLAEYLDSTYHVPTFKRYIEGLPPKPLAPPTPPQSAVTKRFNEEESDLLSCPVVYDQELKQIETEMECIAPYFGGEVIYREVDPINENPLSWYNVKGIDDGFTTALKSWLTQRNGVGKKPRSLDSRKLVSAYQRKEAIWKNKTKPQKGFDTAISFLIDGSLSMREHIKGVCAITSTLAQSLSANNIPFEVSSFTESLEDIKSAPDHLIRKNDLIIEYAKHFDHPLNLKKMAGLSSCIRGLTPDTEALELAMNRIDKRKEKRRIILMLTDGHTCLSGTQFNKKISWNNKTYIPDHIILRHRKTVIEQAKSMGIELYFISIGEGSNFRETDENIVHIKDMDDLNKTVFNGLYDQLMSPKG